MHSMSSPPRPAFYVITLNFDIRQSVQSAGLVDYLEWSRRVRLQDVPELVKHCRSQGPLCACLHILHLFMLKLPNKYLACVSLYFPAAPPYREP